MHRFSPRLDDSVEIPATARHLAGFREWACSDDFPERGRIDFLAGDLEVDMSPEELDTHGLVKTEVATVLQLLVGRQNLGSVYVDRGRVSSPSANLSVEPDVVVVFWETLDRGRVRKVPSKKRPDRFMELEGPPDLIVEIVSDGSVRKDLVRLPPLYAAAGVPELWLVDARGEEIRFEIRSLGAAGYEISAPNRDGWTLSPRLGLRFRLERREVRPGRWSYRLVHAGPAGEREPFTPAR
jgi:Uma2 family endonuclease